MGVEQAAQRGFARILGHALRKMRDDDADVRAVLGLADLEDRRFPVAPISTGSSQ